MTGRGALLSAALLSALVTVAAQQPAPNVLLVTIDTVRADHLGAYGYTKGATPVLDRLAREGIRFDDATTQAPLTGPAHVALLTGIYPGRLGVRDNASTPIPSGTPTLADLFRTNGYRTGGFVGAFILGREYGFAEGFDEFDASFKGYDAGMKLQVQRRGGDVVDRALAWLGKIPASQPFFLWVHLYDAHTPYDPPKPFNVRFRQAPYDGEIAYVDACIGRLIADLERRSLLDRTLVAVVADHGEGLGEHGEDEHGLFLYDSVLRIPWILRLPGRASAGAVVPSQVRAIDVAPTIARLAGRTPPSGIDGQSVVEAIQGRPARDPQPSYAETFYPKWHMGWSELKAVRVGDWKYIDAPKPELYNLRTDRREVRNALSAKSALAGGLSAELARISGGFGGAGASAPQPDPETLERLRGLGYVGIAAPGSGGRGPDPKDMIAAIATFRTGITRALDDLAAGRADAAIAELKRLIALNDRSYELHLFLGDAYQARRQYEQALGEYAAAAVLNPHSGAPALAAARVYLAQGDTARAIQKADESSRVEPTSGELSLVRATIAEKQGLPAQAIAAYETAIRTNPSDARARAGLATLAMQLRRFDIAKPQFEALLELGYRPSRMHFGLGQIAEAQGDTPRAISEYRRVLAAEPGFAPAKEALQRLGAKSGTPHSK
jgi:arylsulfatase A-like enzyme/Tfp pilus assembly protein PilF